MITSESPPINDTRTNMNDITATRPTIAAKTTDPARANNRRNVATFVAFAACVLACSLPLIGGLVAGSFLDKVFDSPVVTVVVGSVVVIAVVGLMQRRKARRSTGANNVGSDACNRFGC